MNREHQIRDNIKISKFSNSAYKDEYIRRNIYLNIHFLNYFLVYSTWESYSQCSKTCGDGEKTRTRTCIGGICSLASSNDMIQTEICNERDCKFY